MKEHVHVCKKIDQDYSRFISRYAKGAHNIPIDEY